MSTPVKELFWLEQEDLDGVDNFFMPADTPPNCPNAFKHRRRMCKEGYERVLHRMVLKQSKEMTDNMAKFSKSVDAGLLPEPRPSPNYHQFVPGQQYVRQNNALFSEAMAFVMQNEDRVEDCTPTMDDMELDNQVDEEALAYKKHCEDAMNASIHRLGMKHQGQRSQLLIHATYGLQRVVESQHDALEKNETPTIQQQPIHSINAKRDPRNRAGYNNYNKNLGISPPPSASPETLYSRSSASSSLPAASESVLISPLFSTSTPTPPHTSTTHPPRKAPFSVFKSYHASQYKETSQYKK